MKQLDWSYSREALIAIFIVLLVSLSQPAFSVTPETFDINRYTTTGAGTFETFYVDKTQTLRSAMADDLVDDETLLLVTSTASGNLALIRDQMSFHHIAQGSSNALDWMVTF
ncbi:MAG: hypothetical protein JKY98_00805 [Gammaproteobacteria bacterium]|nr:hypothetical protein [Gammaproteobacteria bacterium]